ncbi:MAG: energy-coupling factor transporter transmembrane protein EcfT [Tissierellia bacterium]|nr:energy-coupling factor transporter transmembrane protein EcfT [Tissierellia bacterium]
MLYKINPLFKFTGLIIPIIILAFTYNVSVNIALIIISILLLLISGVPSKNIFKPLIWIFIIAISMFITGYKFTSSTQTDIVVLDNRIWNGMNLASRAICFPIMGMCFVLTTKHMDFIKSLEMLTPLSTKFVYGFFAAFQMMPVINEEYKKKKLAFKALGINVLPFSPRLIAPVLSKTVLHSEVLAGAMESRGFNPDVKRTSYVDINITIKDKLFPVVTTLGMIGIIMIFKYVFNLI